MKELDLAKERPMTSQAPMYLFATEAVSDYYKKVGVAGKKILTVCGSGDQVLGACFAGAAEVVCYDININSEYMLDLKIAALKASSYAEFLTFFGVVERSGFDHRQYLGIRTFMRERARRFFDCAYNSYNNDGTSLLLSESCFRQRTKLQVDPLRVNDYLKNEKSYKTMQRLLNTHRFRFIGSGIDQLPSMNEKFDVINLSNIPNYLTRALEEAGVDNPLLEFSNILVRMYDILSRNGVIFYYIYSLKLASHFTKEFQASRPITAKAQSISRIRKYGIEIGTRRIKGISRNSLDKIAIVTACDGLRRGQVAM